MNHTRARMGSIFLRGSVPFYRRSGEEIGGESGRGLTMPMAWRWSLARVRGLVPCGAMEDLPAKPGCGDSFWGRAWRDRTRPGCAEGQSPLPGVSPSGSAAPPPAVARGLARARPAVPTIATRATRGREAGGSAGRAFARAGPPPDRRAAAARHASGPVLGHGKSMMPFAARGVGHPSTPDTACRVI